MLPNRQQQNTYTPTAAESDARVEKHREQSGLAKDERERERIFRVQRQQRSTKQKYGLT